MIRIIDTYPQINTLFENGTFHLEKWEEYINSIYENSAPVFKKDLKDCLDCGFTYEIDILPVINAVYHHPFLEVLHHSFLLVTDRLNERINECLGDELNVDIVLYLGLCNAAGWVTNINGRNVVLLGVEKILELNWHDVDPMYGLIYHELGHIYHNQYGLLDQQGNNSQENFVWQLFVEGIAMCVEQKLVNRPDYFHQDVNGWKEWCHEHFPQILADFHADLPTMTRHNQRYFGDWADYHGHGDIGYYLGTRFIHHLSRKYSLKQLINMKIRDVYALYLSFAQKLE